MYLVLAITCHKYLLFSIQSPNSQESVNNQKKKDEGRYFVPLGQYKRWSFPEDRAMALITRDGPVFPPAQSRSPSHGHRAPWIYSAGEPARGHGLGLSSLAVDSFSFRTGWLRPLNIEISRTAALRHSIRKSPPRVYITFQKTKHNPPWKTQSRSFCFRAIKQLVQISTKHKRWLQRGYL